ncbi:hypothetical protein DIURU_002261 [Diutina rugosa]|uniref:Zn(2)-C6 fungal-type domain-containing protein n=1 Tax=Diutina rugosa TaxID=5481 RepID=A0A642UR35_DIURU|nr:uncharacterized protein DIURU_002261 [Diutina rugosa]KAA8903749.1 hypothetical protein DIURU_002261 [Diutina rugosa]
MTELPLSAVAERKTRRAHKNSRDGCPECKRRRIKCMEELPSCQNCIRKGIRCGYLDMGAVKIQALRDKHALRRRQENRELASILSPAPSASGASGSANTSTLSATATGGSTSANTSTSGATHATSAPSSAPSSTSGAATPGAVNAYVPIPVPLYDTTSVPTPPEPARSSPEWYARIGSPMAVYLNPPASDGDSHIYPPAMPELPELPPPPPHSAPSTTTSVPQQAPVSTPPSGPPLLHAITTTAQFRPHRKLARRLKLDSVKVADPFHPSLARFITIHENYEAVWSNKYRDLYWRILYEVASKLEVYWTFFMDRSLNVLLNECNYFVASKLPNDDGRTSHFTSTDLKFLLKRSYIYYGRLIRTLRTSIDHLHIEYPTKISLFAAWSTFLHPHSQHEVLQTMYGGTILLATKIATESPTLDAITPTIRTMIQLLYTRGSESMIPDYPVTLFHSLRDVFYGLRAWLEDRDYVVGGAQVPRYQQVKFAGLIRFADEFADDTFPALRYLDAHYRPRIPSGYRDPGSLLVVSAKLLFATCVRWFQIFANESLSVGSRMPLISRILYLCFTATARALATVVPTLPAILLVEPFNLMAAETEFNARAYEVTPDKLAPDEFDFLHFITTKLSRVITYLKMRNDSYLYTTSSLPVPPVDGLFNVIRNVDHNTDKCAYTDITYVQAPKVYGGEELPWHPDHSRCRLTIDHYPFIKDAAVKYGWHHLVEAEIARSNAAAVHSPNVFDWDSGLYADDFDARELVRLYCAQCHRELTQSMTLDALRQRVAAMNISRAAMDPAPL